MGPFQLNLAGGHVLVTGGTKGIGHAIVQAFLEEGVSVSYCSRTIRENAFPQNNGTAKALGSAVDIGDASQIQDWVNNSVKQLGPIDAVVANATPFFNDPNIEGWGKSFQADILGLITLIDAATPYLEQRAKALQRDTAIVVLSSLAGFEARYPVPTSPYTTVKGAQAILAKDYSRKLSPLKIRINTIVPGMVENPNIERADGTVELSTFNTVKRDNPAFFQSTLEATPMGRVGEPREIAAAVLFLSSPLASFITGANLVVDGGISITL